VPLERALKEANRSAKGSMKREGLHAEEATCLTQAFQTIKLEG
jgi:hypothetical protein